MELINKGISLNESGKHKEAISYFDRVLSIDTENITAMVDKGFSLEKLQNYDEAIKCYNTALKIDPENLEAWQNKGYTFLLTMDYKEALDCFERVLSIDNSIILAVHGILIASLATKNYYQAEIASKRLMESSREIELISAILLMDYYFHKKSYPDLMELFSYLVFGCQVAEFYNPQKMRGLLQELPFLSSNAMFVDRLANMVNSKKINQKINYKWLDPILNCLIFSDGKKNLVNLEKQAINKIKRIKKQLNTNGNIKDLLKEKFRDPAFQKKISGIKQRFNKAWGLFFEVACNFHEFSCEDVQSLMLEGIGHGKRENYTKAIKSFIKALRLNPYHYDSFGNLGIVLKGYGFPNLAILCYQESLKMFYLNEKCHHNLGLALVEVNRIDDAIAHFEESLRLGISIENNNLDYALRKKKELLCKKQETKNEYVNYNDLIKQGNAYIRKGDWNQAIKCLEIAISIKPPEPEPYLKIGLVYQHIGKNSTAVKTLEKFLDIVLPIKKDSDEKDLASAYHALGIGYGHMGISSNDHKYIKKGIEMFAHSVHHDPKLPENYHLIGGLYLHKKAYEKAIKNFLKAIELSPNLDEAYGELGQAYIETGQIEKAVNAFKDAFKINPSNPIHLNNLNALKSYEEDSKT